jgi:HD superfamily phosphohydrolase
MNKRKIFNDPVHGFITIPHELIFDIIEHPYFQRLRRIKQLALSDYVYPGAIHTRFHHALGAFHLMRKALSILKLKGSKITEAEELGAEIAILLHDIGHGPFSHTLEKCLIAGVHHEDISKIYLNRLNKHFKGKLSLAIQIFEGTYKKKFLHQLVSSQLDVDRLDYLTRDAFFTGVNEGAISYERIIEMMTVRNDELVVEQKGIYSIESFITARRLMYWQVYLHKTVLCAEQMVVKAIERAKYLVEKGEHLEATAAFAYFLKHKVTLKDFEQGDKVIKLYSQLDDIDIFSAFKHWQYHSDKVLSLLCTSILERRLFKTETSKAEFDAKEIEALTKRAMATFKISKQEAAYLVFSDTTSNHAYNPDEDSIKIIIGKNKLVDITKASDQLNISVLSEPVTKHYLFYPKNLA